MSQTLVIGANGTVGTGLVEILKNRGVAVRRATSRAPQAADEVHLDLVKQQGLDAAFRGVKQAFLLSPPGHTNQDALLIPVIDAAKRHGVEKIVLMTAMGANLDPSSPLRKTELHLEGVGLAYNIIRPNWFMQNFNSYWLHGIHNERTIALPVGTARGSFIDARDISAVAAALLMRHDLDNRDFDLTGATALNHEEVARILSSVTGLNIKFQDITPKVMRPGLLAAGLPPDYADFLLIILSFFKMGYAERTTDAVQTITGQAPRSFEEYARYYRSAWLD